MTEYLINLLYIVLSVAIPVIVGYVRTWLKAKAETEGAVQYQFYIDWALECIEIAVSETNQTYVDALKGKNKFDVQAQEQARQMSLTKAKQIMGDKALETLEKIVGDVDTYVMAAVEAYIKNNK